MALTKLTWEEVSQYTPVENPDNLMIFENGGKYFEVVEMGIASVRKVFDFDADALNTYLSGKRTAYDLGIYSQTGQWPMTTQEKEKFYKQDNLDDVLAKIKKEATESYNSTKK